MPVSMSQLSVPAFARGLSALSGLLDKGQAYAASKKVEEAVLLQARLYPDMFPFVRQVQTVCDFAKGAVSRLAEMDNPNFPDTETTFAALKERAARTLDLIRSVRAEAIDGSETRTITIKGGGQTMTFEGQAYLLTFVLPNFYFHLATAHGILRHNGVEIGKRDFLGGL